jgi:hypothetical protein
MPEQPAIVRVSAPGATATTTAGGATEVRAPAGTSVSVNGRKLLQVRVSAPYTEVYTPTSHGGNSGTNSTGSVTTVRAPLTNVDVSAGRKKV